jgi:hypothetical protein
MVERQLPKLHTGVRFPSPAHSGILTIKEDVAMTKAFGELIKEEQGRRFRTEDATGLPPNSKDFALLQNEAALRVVPKDFERQCLSAADYK